jgi:glucose/arabinose dehydrogenase
MMRIQIMRIQLGILACVCLLASVPALAQDNKPAKEEDFYPLFELPIPEGVVLESGALELMPDGKLAASSRRGDVYLISNPRSNDPEQIEFKLFATGLHEVLGLSYKDGALYATQRPEITRLVDEDGDGLADLYETFADGWEINGDYHEYAFGSKFDREGNIWTVLCLTGSFSSEVLYRGWCLRFGPDGKTIPTCSGVRSPGGIGMNAEGDMFYSDNQGPWNGPCGLKHLKPGKFVGHPGGFRWYEATGGVMGPKPTEPKSKSRMMVEAKRIPELEPTAVAFPYPEMGQSTSGIACDTSGGKFGPFANQLFVGDQAHSTVMRVYLEKVNGHYQGACFPFRQGLSSGALGMVMDQSGALFVGTTARGWGARGGKEFSLERINWTGKVPFEIHEMRARPDGFELTFTKPVDAKTAGDVKSYKLKTFDHIYQADYGSPKVDATEPTILRIEVGSDGKSARLFVQGLQEGHVHDLLASGVRSTDDEPLLHPQAYYTLNYIPGQ